MLSQNEIKVYLEILVLYGLCPVSSRRLFGKSDSVWRNTTICNAVRLNRYDKIIQHIHFADNSVLSNADKYAQFGC